MASFTDWVGASTRGCEGSAEQGRGARRGCRGAGVEFANRTETAPGARCKGAEHGPLRRPWIPTHRDQAILQREAVGVQQRAQAPPHHRRLQRGGRGLGWPPRPHRPAALAPGGLQGCRHERCAPSGCQHDGMRPPVGACKAAPTISSRCENSSSMGMPATVAPSASSTAVGCSQGRCSMVCIGGQERLYSTAGAAAGWQGRQPRGGHGGSGGQPTAGAGKAGRHPGTAPCRWSWPTDPCHHASQQPGDTAPGSAAQGSEPASINAEGASPQAAGSRRAPYDVTCACGCSSE